MRMRSVTNVHREKDDVEEFKDGGKFRYTRLEARRLPPAARAPASRARCAPGGAAFASGGLPPRGGAAAAGAARRSWRRARRLDTREVPLGSHCSFSCGRRT